MEERHCANPGCVNTLSDRVPAHILHCGEHQLPPERLAIVYPQVRKYPEVVSFLSSHHNGATIEDLSKFWRMPANILRGYARRGTLKAKKFLVLSEDSKRHWVWTVFPNEIIRVSWLYFRCISLSQAADLLGFGRSTISRYARLGLLGDVFLTPGDVQVIERSDDLRKKVAEIARKEKQRKADPGRFLRRDEIKLSVIAGKMGISDTAVCKRVQKGELKARKRGKKLWAVKKASFDVFLQGIVERTIPSKRKVYLRAQVLINGQNTK